MLGYYNVYAITLRNNKEIGRIFTGKTICEEIKEKELVLTWDNLTSEMWKHGLTFDFTIYNFKKGRIISFFDFKLYDKNTWDIREWKYKELNIKIHYIYIPIVRYSIQDILNYPNAKLAKQFLEQERAK